MAMAEPSTIAVTRDRINFVTEHGSSLTASSHLPTATQNEKELPLGRQFNHSLMPGNHGRLFKIQLPPISTTVTRPTFFDVEHFLSVRSDLPAYVKSPSLLLVTTIRVLDQS